LVGNSVELVAYQLFLKWQRGMNKLKAWIFGLLALLILGGVTAAMIPAKTLVVPSVGQHQFVLDEPMQRVRKILVRTNAVKKIVAMADAQLLEQKWLQMQLELARPLFNRDWHLDGTGQLIVETNDSYIGQYEITLEQSVDITPDRLFAINKLSQPIGPIQQYTSTIELTPDKNGNAKISSSLKLEIKTTASWLTSSIVESEIRVAAQNALEKQEQAIRQIVESHRDELIILPDANTEE